VSHAELMIFGALIVWFLIVEPHGLAKLWSTGKQKLRLWPSPTLIHCNLPCPVRSLTAQACLRVQCFQHNLGDFHENSQS
jgi:hypothetical protein